MNDGTRIPLSRTPLVTSADLTAASASPTQGRWGLNLDVTHEAAKRVQDFSKQHVGRTIAFLVDGESPPRASKRHTPASKVVSLMRTSLVGRGCGPRLCRAGRIRPSLPDTWSLSSVADAAS